jgi:thioredoxin reductase
MKADTLVIGGGIAGMVAAYKIASQNHTVIILDRKNELGGQMIYQTQIIDDMPKPFEGMRGFEIVGKLKSMLRQLSVSILLQTELVGVFADGSIGFFDGKKIDHVYAESIVIATGAAEQAVIFPGWTLPGILTVGAAQTLINHERIYPGRNCVIIGSGNMALVIAQQLQAVGIQVEGVVEQSGIISAKDTAIINAFLNSGIKLYLNTEVRNVEGENGKVRWLELYMPDHTLKRIETDFICTDGGIQPIVEAFSVLNCKLDHVESLGGMIPSYDFDFQTTARGVFAAGQAAGVTIHAGIFLTGILAGIGALRFLRASNMVCESEKRLYHHTLKKIEREKVPAVSDARDVHMLAYKNEGNEGSVNG